MDVFTKNIRSEIMRAVKSKGNKSTELRLISIFKQNRITGWRRNYPLFGNPDFVFLKERVAIFIDGCFWHCHGCRNTMPKGNADYWKKKFQRNRKRDALVTKTLKAKKWKVLRIWECELKSQSTLRKLRFKLKRI